MLKTKKLLTEDLSEIALCKSELSQALRLIIAENEHALEQIQCHECCQVVQAVLQSKRVFAVGEGRSGLALEMAAMRLMHLGLEVHIVGEVSAPSIEAGDLLIACSGSGSTPGVVVIAQSAKKIGAHIAAVTTQADSPLGKLADTVIQINAATKLDYSHQQSQQFGGSLFEQATLLLFDALFYVLSHQLNKSDEVLMARHTNLE